MAQKLKFGNGTWATKEGSTLAYNNENNNFKPLPFSFTRNSIATRVNKEGLIEVVGNDIPRIDYTDSTEGALLLENSATNYLTQSNQFDTTWNLQNITISSNQNGVGGSIDAWKLIPSIANTYHRITNSVSGTQNLAVTLSVYAKADGYNFLRITENGSTGDYATFNLLDGIVENNTSSEAKIESVGNGWYRCSSSIVATTSHRFDMYVMESAEVQEPWEGNGTSGIYIQYAQLESGNLSSYIPTNGSTVQRAAETCNESGNSEVFNDSEGVLMAEIAYPKSTTSSNLRITISDGTSSNRILIQNVSSTPNRLQFYVIANGGTSTDFYTNLSDITSFNKIVFKYKTNDFSVWINGFEVLTDTSGSTFSDGTLNELAFDGGDGANDFYGKTKEIAYYDTTLTDAELETLTSYRSLNELVTELNLNTL